jgi:hypothetical protein
MRKDHVPVKHCCRNCVKFEKTTCMVENRTKFPYVKNKCEGFLVKSFSSGNSRAEDE